MQKRFLPHNILKNLYISIIEPHFEIAPLSGGVVAQLT